MPRYHPLASACALLAVASTHAACIEAPPLAVTPAGLDADASEIATGTDAARDADAPGGDAAPSDAPDAVTDAGADAAPPDVAPGCQAAPLEAPPAEPLFRDDGPAGVDGQPLTLGGWTLIGGDATYATAHAEDGTTTLQLSPRVFLRRYQMTGVLAVRMLGASADLRVRASFLLPAAGQQQGRISINLFATAGWGVELQGNSPSGWQIVAYDAANALLDSNAFVPPAPDAWHDVQITARGGCATFWLDGEVLGVFAMDGEEVSQIALVADRSGADFDVFWDRVVAW